MRTATRVTTTMIIAMAMVGMAGFAMAGSTTANYVGDGSYNMDFDGMGTGSMDVFTLTNTGFDHMSTGWSDTNVSGHQDMYTDSHSDGEECTWTETDITRNVRVGTGGTGQDASGYIQTYTTDGGDNSVSTSATYHDDEAYGSNVHTKQNVVTSAENCNDCEGSGIDADTTINGGAWGADTLVTGTVLAHSGSQSGNMTALAVMKMTQGGFNLGIDAFAYSGVCEGEAGAGVGLGGAGVGLGDDDAITMTGTGRGNATIAGFTDTIPGIAEFDLTGIDDGIGYQTDGTINGTPVSMNVYDDFDTGYTGTGYIYVYNGTMGPE